MKNSRQLIWLIFFGSLWGLGEAIAGEAFFREEIANSPVWLSAWAFFLLAIARGVLDKPGSSTAIGAVATMFKLIHTAPFFCHLLGIFTLGIAFDITASLLIRPGKNISLRTGFMGVISAFGGFSLFSLLITYVFRYEYWVMGGTTKVLNHIFVSGSLAAMAAYAAVTIGSWIGIRGENFYKRHPSLAFNSALTASLVIWLMVRIAG